MLRYLQTFFVVGVITAVCSSTGIGAESNRQSTTHRLNVLPPIDSSEPRGDSLVRATLVANGDYDAFGIETWHTCYLGHAFEVSRRLLNADGSDRQRLQCIFQYLHEQVLTGRYDKDCSDLGKTLAEGDYNCLTATLLYCTLCQDCGLSVQAVSMPGHVRAGYRGALHFDVEVTSAKWLEILTPQSSTESDRRTLSNQNLLGRVHYNRGLQELECMHFDEALHHLERACELDDQDESAGVNLLAAINNWALSLADVGEFSEAVDLLTRGQELAPRYRSFRTNDCFVHGKWVMELCAAEQFQQAAQVLQIAHERRPEVEMFDGGRWTIYEFWICTLTNEGEPEVASRILSSVEEAMPDAVRQRLISRVAESVPRLASR